MSVFYHVNTYKGGKKCLTLIAGFELISNWDK